MCHHDWWVRVYLLAIHCVRCSARSIYTERGICCRKENSFVQKVSTYLHHISAVGTISCLSFKSSNVSTPTVTRVLPLRDVMRLAYFLVKDVTKESILSKE